MTPERWQEVQDVLEKALELAPSDRFAFLNRACSSDPSLRQEVETLIASRDDMRSSFLQAPSSSITLAAGTKVGDYEVKSLLGAGGMGEVYRARDARLGRDVAIKVLPSFLCTDSERLRRFEQEARAAAALNHPNILAVFQMGTYEGSPYMVSELLEGETLREQITRGRMTIRKAIDYGIQIARGLAAAHEKGVVHRDLKPENLFATKDGRVKILDFGLAKLTQPQSSSEHDAPTLTEGTEAGVVMGTVGYMAPEQVRGEAADHRADIFAFGAILYEMLAGKRAFQEPTSPETMTAILNEDPPGISQATTNVPPALQRVVHRCLEKNPEQRFQSASDLAFALDTLSEPSSNAAGNAVSALRRRNLRFGIGALLLVLAGITWGVYYKLATVVPFQRTLITRLTTSGKVTMAVISPDGRYVAYVTGEAEFGGRETVWVRQVGAGSEVQIVPPADARYVGLTFSRDGDFLYVTQSESLDSSIGILYKMPVLGGTKKKMIVDVAIRPGFFVNPVTPSPDGKRVAFLRDSKPTSETALIVANEDGSGERQLAARKMPNSFAGMVAWSPNGKTIATVVGDTDEAGVEYASLVEVSVQGGAERPVTQKRWRNIVDLAWLPDGRGLVVDAQEQNYGPVQIVYVSYANGDVRRITNDLNYYLNVSVTANSRIVATTHFEYSYDVWIASVGAVDDAKPITSDGRASGATWSPDGRIVDFNFEIGSIRLMGSDGSNPKQLTSNTEGTNQYPRVSSDGHYIVFVSDRAGSEQIWRIDSDGNNPKQLTDSPFQEPGLDCSPDGKWVLYSKVGPEKGVWKVPMEGGNPVRLSDRDAHRPAISPDGTMIAYAYKDASEHPPRGIAIMAFEGGTATKHFDISRPSVFRWAADGRSLLYTNRQGGVDNIWSQSMGGGTPRQITHFKSDLIGSFDLSRDGKRLVISRGATKQDVVLIRDLT